MRPWTARSPEVANLVNAPLCSLLLNEFAKGFDAETRQGADILLCFLALPLILHRETRCLLPITVATKHADWVQTHGHLKIGFPERCRSLAPFVREAVEFGARAELLEVTSDGRLRSTRKRLKSTKWKLLGDNQELLKAAVFSGRWLAHSGRTSTIYALWGVKP